MTEYPTDVSLALLVSVLGIALLSVPTPVQAEVRSDILFQFDKPEAAGKWIAVNDNVMGGVSKGGAQLAEGGVLLFSGTLSLENRGGFSSIRSVQEPVDLSANEGLVIRVRGDGRRYWLTLTTDRRIVAGSYRIEFDTTSGKWMEVRAPFAKFRATAFGRELVGFPPPDPAKVQSVGFLIADKKAGPFSLQVDWIKTYRSDATGQVTASPADAETRTQQDIVDTVLAAENLKLLASALKTADLVSTLKGDGPFTVFAPTDEAFGQLPEGALNDLLEPRNRKKLVSVLTNHVVPGRVILRRRTPAEKTLEGSELTIGSTGDFKVNGVRVLTPDIKASNGVIHVIDGVLLPDSFGIPKAGSAARLIELAIKRGVPLFNSGNVGACKAVYEVTAEALLCLPPGELSERDKAQVRAALQRVRKSGTPREHAWILREALDATYAGVPTRSKAQ